MGNGVGLADVGQELVAQAFAFGGAGDQAGDVDEFHGGGHDSLGLYDFGQFGQAWVGHGHHAGIGFDGAEREVLCADAGFGQCVEQGRFADVGKADDAAVKSHGMPLLELKNLGGLYRGIGTGASKGMCLAQGVGLKLCRRFMAAASLPLAASGSTRMTSSKTALSCSVSCLPRRPSTKPVTLRLSPGWPMPRRKRWKSLVPRWAMLSRRPLWPPWPPPFLSLAVPGGRSSSSWATRICSGEILKKSDRALIAVPLRFMKVLGFRRCRSRPCH